MNGIPIFDNINYVDKDGNLTDSIRNNLSNLYTRLQVIGSSQINTNIDVTKPTQLAPDVNYISKGSAITPYQLPTRCPLSSKMTVTNPGLSTHGFVINIGLGQSIQYLGTLGTTSLTMTDDGAAVTLDCINPDKDFLVISNEGAITLV